MARRGVKRSARSSDKARASWRGMLRFGLVSFPVEGFNAHAAEQGQVALHQLHTTCHSRIRYQRTCPIHGPVSNDEIVSGYEVSKGKYVEVSREELNDLRSEADRSLTIDTFIAPDELDEIYFDGRMYYLAPDGDQSREPYAVFLDALRRQKRWGVGQVVFSGKEQIVVVREHQHALQMAMLNYHAEIREPGGIVGALPTVKGSDRKVHLAEQLIESWTDSSFDFEKYEDAHLHRLKELIQSKSADRNLVTPDVEEEPEVINLMDALKKSLGKSGRTQSHGKNGTAHSARIPPKPARKSSRTKKRRAS